MVVSQSGEPEKPTRYGWKRAHKVARRELECVRVVREREEEECVAKEESSEGAEDTLPWAWIDCPLRKRMYTNLNAARTGKGRRLRAMAKGWKVAESTVGTSRRTGCADARGKKRARRSMLCMHEVRTSVGIGE